MVARERNILRAEKKTRRNWGERRENLLSIFFVRSPPSERLEEGKLI